jgi:hypothetical protein
MFEPGQGLKRLVDALDGACRAYEVHAACCNTCGMRTGAFCELGSELLDQQAEQMRAVGGALASMTVQLERVSDLYDRANFNSQLDR